MDNSGTQSKQRPAGRRRKSPGYIFPKLDSTDVALWCVSKWLKWKSRRRIGWWTDVSQQQRRHLILLYTFHNRKTFWAFFFFLFSNVVKRWQNKMEDIQRRSPASARTACAAAARLCWSRVMISAAAAVSSSSSPGVSLSFEPTKWGNISNNKRTKQNKNGHFFFRFGPFLFIFLFLLPQICS